MVNVGALPGEIFDTAMIVIVEYVFPYEVGCFFFLSACQVRDVVEGIWKALLMGN